MKPTNFPEANFTLVRIANADLPPKWFGTPLKLHFFRNLDAVISCWTPTWGERLAMLFGRPVWLWVFGTRHPSVAVEVHNPFEEA